MPDSPRQHTAIEEDGDEYIVYRNVPVFDEHQGDDGVFWGKQLLQCIAQNNNDRIEDTGDWCPIVVGHTPDPDDDGKGQPEIIGYAGPFSVSVIGNKTPRNAIVADFRIFADKKDTYRQNPRRSVELWPEEDPTKAFFDPIAVLGAETPRRALGIVYSRPGRKGKQPIKYEMGGEGGGESVTHAAPGGTNTFIPGGKKKKKHAMDELDFAGSGKDAAQLLEAFKPAIQQIAAETVNGILENQISLEDQQEAEAAMTPDMQDPIEAPADPAMEAPVDPAMGMPADPAMDVPVEPEVEEPSAFSKYFKAKLQKYQADEEMDEHDKLKCAKELYDKLDDDDKVEALSILDAPGDDDDDDTKSFYAKARYQCDDGEDCDDDEEAEKNSKYAKRFAKADRERKQLAQKNAKLQRDLQRSQRAQKYAKRRGEFAQLEQEGYVVDADDLMELSGGLSDQQHKLLYSLIRRSAQRVPTKSVAKFARAPERKTPEQKDTELMDKATDLVQQYRKEGRKINFAKAMKIVAGDNEG